MLGATKGGESRSAPSGGHSATRDWAFERRQFLESMLSEDKARSTAAPTATYEVK